MEAVGRASVAKRVSRAGQIIPGGGKWSEPSGAAARRLEGLTVEAIAPMCKKLARLRAAATLIQDRYGELHLHLAVGKTSWQANLPKPPAEHPDGMPVSPALVSRLTRPLSPG